MIVRGYDLGNSPLLLIISFKFDFELINTEKISLSVLSSLLIRFISMQALRFS